MTQAIGRGFWAIAEGYIPSTSHGPEGPMTSHETACILNANDAQAHVMITILFSHREPAGPYRLVVEPRRTAHVRFNDLKDPEPIPRDTGLCRRHRVRRAHRGATHAPGLASE